MTMIIILKIVVCALEEFMLTFASEQASGSKSEFLHAQPHSGSYKSRPRPINPPLEVTSTKWLKKHSRLRNK